MRVKVFDLIGTETQNQIVAAAIAEQDYPWERLDLSSVGREAIPVEWADLSRYAVDKDAQGHVHIHEGDETAHPIEGEFEGRRRVLGLAWYSGKVTIEQALESEPVLAREVFHSEGAHMADFFDPAITPEVRKQIFAAYHPDMTPEQLAAHTEHGWFEETGNNDYWSWVGESFMEGFIYAFTPLRPPSTRFDHPTTEAIGQRIRQLLLSQQFFGTAGSSVFHDSHKGIKTDFTWPTYDSAVAAGRRPCGICKPEVK